MSSPAAAQGVVGPRLVVARPDVHTCFLGLAWVFFYARARFRMPSFFFATTGAGRCADEGGKRKGPTQLVPCEGRIVRRETDEKNFERFGWLHTEQSKQALA